jgi:hypothetical protein
VVVSGCAGRARHYLERMERSRVRWGWIVAAVLVVLVVGLSLVIQAGGCASGSTDTCSTEPLGGWPAAWVRIVVGGLFLVFAVLRAVRARKQ